MFLAQVATALEFVAIFKPSRAGRLSKSHDGEVRKRCRHCGWVNVFHPERASLDSRMLEFKNVKHVAVGGAS